MPKRKKLATRKNIEIDNDLLEWLDEEYEGMSIWTLVNSLIRSFKDIHKTPNRLATLYKKAARTTLEDLNDV